MGKIYELTADYMETRKAGFFLESYNHFEEAMQYLTIRQNWQPFVDYQPVSLELCRNDMGYKNYKFDFCSFLSPFFIFSEHAVNVLKDILEPRGQFLEVITESKRKKFIGYYPTHVYPKGILDLEKSDYLQNEEGLMAVRKAVLIKEKIPDEYLFTIEEDTLRVFVTEKFKQLVEDNNLLGFWFSEYNEIELS